MKKELLESIFKELEHMNPDYRKKVARPLLSLGPCRFTGLQRMTMVFLFRAGPQPMNAIATFHGISKQQMTPLVEGLEKQKMVRRAINPKNRREVIVSVTSEGKKAFGEMRKEAMKQWMDKLDCFSDDEIKEIIVHLHAINGFLKRLDEEK
jgi:DNA-binding MarR family transcriptional regulator